VVHDEQGEVETVRYDQLVPMLLNEVQKQQKQIATLVHQSEELAAVKAQLAEQAQRVAQVEAQTRVSVASR